MSQFKIEILLNTNLFTTPLEKKIVYFSKNNINYEDKINFDEKTIILSGSRTKHINNANILETVNSSYFACLTKALLFAYFDKASFEIKSITIYIDNSKKKTYKINEIHQVFKKDTLIKINTDKLFSNKNISDTIMVSLMYLTLSFNYSDLRFDYTWKCFNSLIRDIFNKKQDFDMLKELRYDLEKNPTFYPNILSWSRGIECHYLDQCFLNAMICNNYPKGTTNGLANFCKDFQDTRVLTTLKEKISLTEQIEKPIIFRENFPEHQLSDAEDIIWLKLEFSEMLTSEVFENVSFNLNCFPIVNIKNTRLFRRMNGKLDIVSIQSDDHLLDLDYVKNDEGDRLDLKNDNQRINVVLRRGGVARFDQRNASELLQYLSGTDKR